MKKLKKKRRSLAYKPLDLSDEHVKTLGFFAREYSLLMKSVFSQHTVSIKRILKAYAKHDKNMAKNLKKMYKDGFGENEVLAYMFSNALELDSDSADEIMAVMYKEMLRFFKNIVFAKHESVGISQEGAVLLQKERALKSKPDPKVH